MTAARTRSRTSRSMLAGLAAAALTVAGLVATPGAPAQAAPGVVTLVGSLQSEAGCANDWDPTCAATDLAPTTISLVWRRDRDDEVTQVFVGVVRGRTARSSRG